MKENLLKTKIPCPKCNSEFEINARIFGIDDTLTCFNCGFVFTIRGDLLDTMKTEIIKIKKEIKSRIKEAEKGNLKISSKDLKEMRDTLNKYEF